VLPVAELRIEREFVSGHLENGQRPFSG
jgi:hypothetical protein